MRTYTRLYEKVCSYENLLLAYGKARKRKSNKPYVREFEANLETNLLQLKHELETQAYSPRLLTSFVIRDPKTRRVSAADFRDRIVHHAVCNVIAPSFEKSFIHDSFANRTGKGIHSAIKRFEQFARSVAGNGKPTLTKNTRSVWGYVLKADIKRYFETVDHDVLVGIIRNKIRDKKVILLIGLILKNYNSGTPGRGMPLGNLTSQFFANVYLNELDQYVKHTLQARHYIRYVDDFVILHRDRKVLEGWRWYINAFLNRQLRIGLHPEKSKIAPLRRGLTFLGYRIFFKHRLLKKGNVRRIWRRLELLRQENKCNQVGGEHIKRSFDGWLGYALFANTFNLRKRVMGEIRTILA